MAETSTGEAADAPVIAPGQTTAVGENTGTEQQVLDGEVASEDQGFFGGSSMFIWIAAFLWIWFFFGNKKRRTARAQEKKDAERRNSLQKGDRIVTIGRMHGTVVAYTDDTVTIKPDTKSDHTMTFDRQAIYRVLPRPGEEPDGEAAK